MLPASLFSQGVSLERWQNLFTPCLDLSIFSIEKLRAGLTSPLSCMVQILSVFIISACESWTFNTEIFVYYIMGTGDLLFSSLKSPKNVIHLMSIYTHYFWQAFIICIERGFEHNVFLIRCGAVFFYPVDVSHLNFKHSWISRCFRPLASLRCCPWKAILVLCCDFIAMSCLQSWC